MRRSRHFRWEPEPTDSPAHGPLSCGVQLGGLYPPLGAHDEVVLLLHTAAEIEHSLLVQYLYAAYSLDMNPKPPAQEPPLKDEDAVNLVRMWRDSLVTIAVQEMAHLLTVQNLLRFVGGPLNFEREDFPVKSELYPFPFGLRPLTAESLASYIVAEMPRYPSRETFPPEREEDIRARIPQDCVNRVGALYERLIVLFNQLDPRLFRPGSIEFQARPEEWGADSDLLVHGVKSLEDALRALETVGRQGEGWEDHPKLESHFHRFLEIYTHPQFQNASKGSWTPTRPVPTNPVTKPRLTADAPASDGAEGQTVITNKEALCWAHLFNARYRMVLFEIDHSLRVGDASVQTDDGPMPLRQALISWSRRQMTSGLREIAMTLMELPVADGSSTFAAPPFELPDSLAVPERDCDRWLRHLDMIEASNALMTDERCGTRLGARSAPVLNRLRKLDDEMKSFIATHRLDEPPEPSSAGGA